MICLHPSIASSFVTPSLCVLPLFLLPNNSKFPHSVNICQPVHYTIYKRSMQSEVNPNFTLNPCHSYHISVILLPTYTFCHSFFLHTIPQLLSLYLIVFFFFFFYIYKLYLLLNFSSGQFRKNIFPTSPIKCRHY